jgi:hypothetical protein
VARKKMKFPKDSYAFVDENGLIAQLVGHRDVVYVEFASHEMGALHRLTGEARQLFQSALEQERTDQTKYALGAALSHPSIKAGLLRKLNRESPVLAKLPVRALPEFWEF